MDKEIIKKLAELVFKQQKIINKLAQAQSSPKEVLNQLAGAAAGPVTVWLQEHNYQTSNIKVIFTGVSVDDLGNGKYGFDISGINVVGPSEAQKAVEADKANLMTKMIEAINLAVKNEPLVGTKATFNPPSFTYTGL
jgi:hypothetical protein